MQLRSFRTHLRSTPLLRGAAEALAVLGGFVAFGFGLAAFADDEAPYSSRVPPEAAREIWLVDGYNAICAGLLGGRSRAEWWSARYREELLTRLQGFDDTDAELWVVFDGGQAPAPEEPPGRVRVVFAEPADRWLVEEAGRRADASPVVVVTADRQVAGRARHRGARIVSPAELLGRC